MRNRSEGSARSPLSEVRKSGGGRKRTENLAREVDLKGGERWQLLSRPARHEALFLSPHLYRINNVSAFAFVRGHRTLTDPPVTLSAPQNLVHPRHVNSATFRFPVVVVGSRPLLSHWPGVSRSGHTAKLTFPSHHVVKEVRGHSFDPFPTRKLFFSREFRAKTSSPCVVLPRLNSTLVSSSTTSSRLERPERRSTCVSSFEPFTASRISPLCLILAFAGCATGCRPLDRQDDRCCRRRNSRGHR